MKGFAAIVSVIVISAVLIVAGMMVTLTSINEGQMSLSGMQKGNNVSILDACVEDSLLFINTSNTLPQNIVTPDGNCTATLNSQVGTSWDFTVTASLNDYSRSSRIKINRATTIDLSSWQDE